MLLLSGNLINVADAEQQRSSITRIQILTNEKMLTYFIIIGRTITSPQTDRAEEMKCSIPRFRQPGGHSYESCLPQHGLH